MNKWVYSNVEENGTYIGIIEFEIDGEWHNFEMYQTPERIVFGGFCNVGFMESGYMLRDNSFSLDENVVHCLNMLEEFYANGKDYEATELYLTQRM